MNQRGYINIILIILVVILTGVVGYLTLVKKQAPPTTNQIPPTNTSTEQTQPTTSPTPEVTSPTSTPKDETTNWKTYKNERLGYEIKYPPTGEIVSDLTRFPESLAIQLKPYSSYFQIDVFSALQSLKEYLDEKRGWVEVQTQKEIQIAGLPAIQRGEFHRTANFTYLITYFKKGDKMFTISIMPIEQGKGLKLTDKERNLYNQILSTFKFLK